MKKLLLVTASVIALSTAPTRADPVSAAVALASTASSAFLGGGLASVFGLTGAANFAANFAIRAALGYALNALTAKPNAVTRGYSTTVNALGAALPHQVIYGEVVTGGAVTYQSLTGVSSEYLHRVICFAGHEIDSYQAIYVNGEEVTLDGSGNVTAPSKWVGNIRIKEYLGTTSQAADSDLSTEVSEWTTAHQGKGIAYLYVRFMNASTFPNGTPVVTAKIRGKKVEDTRTSTTAWSDNPALCIRDYLLSGYGLGESSTNIDDTLFEAAATACEVQIGGADTYTCNGAFLLDASPEGIIRSMLSSMGGTFWNYGGNWATRAAGYITPTLTLNEDDLRTNVTIATRHSRRDNFNAVHGTYRGAETDWQEDNYTSINPGLFLYEDNDIEAIAELPLLFTSTDTMAQRIARTFLRRNREQITVTAGFGLAALDLKVSDTVMLTVSHYGWSQKVFEVVDWRMGMTSDMDIVINMILREMSEEVFTGIVRGLEDESANTLTDESGNTLEAIAA